MRKFRWASMALATLFLAGCASFGVNLSASISGKIAQQSAKHPKIGMMVAEGDTKNEVLDALDAKMKSINDAVATHGSFSFTSTADPLSNGSYSLALSSPKAMAAFMVFCWDDADGNNLVNPGDGALATASAAPDEKAYSFIKDVDGVHRVKGSTLVSVDSIASYDWGF